MEIELEIEWIIFRLFQMLNKYLWIENIPAMLSVQENFEIGIDRHNQGEDYTNINSSILDLQLTLTCVVRIESPPLVCVAMTLCYVSSR